MALYSSSCTSLDVAKKQAELDGEPTCQCGEFAADDDTGFCLGCGLWINYRENQ